jgi:hypothetical protein
MGDKCDVTWERRKPGNMGALRRRGLIARKTTTANRVGQSVPILLEHSAALMGDWCRRSGQRRGPAFAGPMSNEECRISSVHHFIFVPTSARHGHKPRPREVPCPGMKGQICMASP